MKAKVNKKIHSVRPSMFLNEFDMNTFIQSPGLKTENNERVQLPPINVESSESKQKTTPFMLPNIVNRFKRKKRVNAEQGNEIEQQLEKQKLPIISEQVSPASGQLVKLPEISLYSPQYPKPPHKKNQTEEIGQQKRVEFRASILVIDFVNDILKKDKIDGSSKPLTKRLQRQPTKFLQNLQRNIQI